MRFDLTDTGGMFGASEDPLHDMVSARGQRALADGRSSSCSWSMPSRARCPATRRSPQALRGSGKPVVLAVNKSDDRRAQAGTLEFYQLGFEPVIEISAEHGRGIGDLLEEVIARLGSRAAPVTEPAGEAADAGERAPESVRSPARRARRTRRPWRSSAGPTSASRRW